MEGLGEVTQQPLHASPSLICVPCDVEKPLQVPNSSLHRCSQNFPSIAVPGKDFLPLTATLATPALLPPTWRKGWMAWAMLPMGPLPRDQAWGQIPLPPLGHWQPQHLAHGGIITTTPPLPLRGQDCCHPRTSFAFPTTFSFLTAFHYHIGHHCMHDSLYCRQNLLHWPLRRDIFGQAGPKGLF